MNREQLINEIVESSSYHLRISDGDINRDQYKGEMQGIVDLLEDLDEFKPVELPGFACKWIEHNSSIKSIVLNIFCDCPEYRFSEKDTEQMFDWLDQDFEGNLYKLIKAVKYGYKKEPEKKYEIYDQFTGQYIVGTGKNNNGIEMYYWSFNDDIPVNCRKDFTKSEVENIRKGEYLDMTREVTEKVVVNL